MTTEATMDPEQRFLQSRLSRSSARDVAITRNVEEIRIFWMEIRRRLDAWKNQLETLHESQPVRSNLSPETTSGSIRQQLEDLKQYLHLLRKHCLGSCTIPRFETLHVPEDLPNADLRLLHTEFSRCAAQRESTQTLMVPKGKFSFQRYRQELARRKAQGEPLYLPAHDCTILSVQPTNDNKPSSSATINPTIQDNCLENISNAVVDIQADGTVHIRHGEKIAMKPAISSAVILLRNLENCDVIIEKELQALHMVNLKSTSVRVTPVIVSAVHVTECQGCTLFVKSQQLRIHTSSQSTFHAELGAGAILEDSNDLVFYGRENEIDVKDFNWLREGIASPNFRFVAATHHETCTEKEDPMKMSHSVSSPGEGGSEGQQIGPEGATQSSLPVGPEAANFISNADELSITECSDDDDEL